MEDGTDECTFSLTILKIYKGESIKLGSTIQTTIISYTINSPMPIIGEDLILFLSKKKEIDSFKLVDNWLGVRYNFHNIKLNRIFFQMNYNCFIQLEGIREKKCWFKVHILCREFIFVFC